MTYADRVEIRHGYTLADLDRIANSAVTADRSYCSDVAYRRDLAWSAVAEALCEAAEPPPSQDLVRAGWQAIYRDVRAADRMRGRRDLAWDAAEPHRPRFAAYWLACRVVPSPETRVVERIAIGQAMAVLTPAAREAVIALAVHGDYLAAADACGLAYSAFTARLSGARRAVDAVWFEHETPRRRRPDRRAGSRTATPALTCRSGHAWADHGRISQGMRNGRTYRRRWCRACERARGARRRQLSGRAARTEPQERTPDG